MMSCKANIAMMTCKRVLGHLVEFRDLTSGFPGGHSLCGTLIRVRWPFFPGFTG